MSTITERQRQRLRQWADRHMDEETADIFMESTPPTGWDDVATKQDLHVLAMGHRAELHQQTTKLLLAFIALTVAAVVGETVLVRWFPQLGGRDARRHAIHRHSCRRAKPLPYSTASLTG